MRSLDLGRPDIGERITSSKCRWRKPRIFPVSIMIIPCCTSPEHAIRDVRLHLSVPFAAGVIVQYFQIGMQPGPVVCTHIIRRSELPCTSSDSPHSARCRRSRPDAVSGPRAGAITVPCSGVMICTVRCFPLVDPVTVMSPCQASTIIPPTRSITPLSEKSRSTCETGISISGIKIGDMLD